MNKVILRITPLSKPRMTRRDKWANRPCVLNYFEYRTKVKSELNKHRFNLPDSFSVKFFLPMPDSWSKKKKLEYVNQPHQNKPDIDNLVKGLLDACLENDSSVYHVDAYKFWSDKPCIEILTTSPQTKI